MQAGDLVSGQVEWLAPEATHPYLVVDVFTSRPLEGNQLGLFLDGRALAAEDMQRLTRELGFSETVFLLPARTQGDVAVRIFTPARELPFAGHPVLGTACAVGQARGVEEITLETKAGLVRVKLERVGGPVVSGRMEQPLPVWGPFARAGDLLRALGVEASLLPIEIYSNGPEHVYVRLPSEDSVAALSPDLAALGEIGVAANCFAGEGRRWKTRVFYPAAGVPEDPATGSAAGPLALHLARHGQIPFGAEIEVRQGAEMGRPSLLYAVARGTPESVEAIEVAGSALVVAEGRFRITVAR